MALTPDQIQETLGGPWQAATLDRIGVIWRTLTRDVARMEGEAGISGTNSKRWTKVDDILAEMGAMLVDEANDFGAAPTDADLLLKATEDIWEYIEKRLTEFALLVEARRTVGRKNAEDYIAPYLADKPQLTPA